MNYMNPNKFGYAWNTTLSFSGSKSLSYCESWSKNEEEELSYSASRSKKRIWFESVSRSSKGIYK